jgi:hypothetical protein
VGAGPWTCSFGGQAAADPNHRSADGAADSPLRLQRGDEPPLTGSLALFALLLPSDVDVHGMDQHLEITSFQTDLSSHDGLRACATRSAISGANRA